MAYAEGYLESEQRAKEKAQELIKRFGDFEIAMNCTEEIIMALYDEGIKRPQFWYYVQESIDLSSKQELLTPPKD